MTVEEYANRHGLSLETVRRYIRSGKLQAKRFGRSYVIDDTLDNTHATTDDTHDKQTQQRGDDPYVLLAQLEALLAASKKQVERLETELSESRQRSDSIIMQLSLTLSKQQSQIRDQTLLIEDLRKPSRSWLRLFQRRKSRFGGERFAELADKAT